MVPENIRTTVTWFCNGLIANSQAVLRYYLETHRANSFLVTYGMRESKCEGIEWLERFGLKSREYVLFVGRLVPENNIHHFISAFERTKTDKKLSSSEMILGRRNM